MARTNFDPKISSTQNAATPSTTTGAAGPKAQTARDLYTTSPADPYRRLLSGARTETRPMQDLIGGLIFGQDSASASDFELPVVPEFYRHIMKNLPGIRIEAVIQKYKDLKKVIQKLKIGAERTRSDPLSAVRMTTSELRALTDHIRQLDGQLIKAEKELALARAHKAKLDARKAAEAEENS